MNLMWFPSQTQFTGGLILLLLILGLLLSYIFPIFPGAIFDSQIAQGLGWIVIFCLLAAGLIINDRMRYQKIQLRLQTE